MQEYGIIGKSLQHSFSPKYFNDKFAALHLDAQFLAFELKQIKDFPELLKNNRNLKGLCITIPYKESIIAYLDILDKSAQQIGAVNCIQFKDNQLIGYNTDIIGFKQSLQPLLHAHHNKALILGTGGAAKAIQQALIALNITFTIVSRTENENCITYAQLNEDIIKAHTIIINCTPLGTFPNIDEKINIPYNFIGHQHIMYDLIYNPALTSFLKAGAQQGAVIKNGLEMLHLQAEANWVLWNH